MILQLFECDNCHWSTFSYTDLRRVMGGTINFHGDGRTITVCQVCLNLLEMAVKYKPYEITQEIDDGYPGPSNGQLHS